MVHRFSQTVRHNQLRWTPTQAARTPSCPELIIGMHIIMSHRKLLKSVARKLIPFVML